MERAMSLLTRRRLLRMAGAACVVPTVGVPQPARSARPVPQPWRHGLSLFGDLKYHSGFAHFDYVNPRASKGGVARQGAFGTYDHFNMVVAGWKGRLAAGLEFIYDTLLAPSMDEASSRYGVLAGSDASC